MELILLCAVALVIVYRLRRKVRRKIRRRNRRVNRKRSPARSTQPEKFALGAEIEGPAFVIDGDSIIIRKVDIRLFGIDAPELNHPYGQNAKWALVALCKGRRVKARVIHQDHYGRTVAHCLLPDGRDLSAEMVRQGLAIDWPKFSGGQYSSLEMEGVRRKLWRADARQKGRATF